MVKPWHAFTAGTHTDNKNRTWEFGREALTNIAQTLIGRPVQIGHDGGVVKTEVADAAVVGDHLVVVPKDVPADLAEQVAGFGLSIQLFQPDHPNNPTPGQWSADHLAFVESPRVRDLLQPAFGDGGVVFETQPVQFGEKEKSPPPPDPKDLEIIRLRKELAKQKHEHWLESVAFGSEGFRLPPHLRETALNLLGVLDQVEPVSFGDGSKPAVELFQELIQSLPLAVAFGDEISKPVEPEPVAFGIAPGYQANPKELELYQKAKKYQLQNPGTDLKTAYLAVGGA